jgi:hypothetical protein
MGEFLGKPLLFILQIGPGLFLMASYLFLRGRTQYYVREIPPELL